MTEQEFNKKRQQAAVASTLSELRTKLSVAESFNESGDPESALYYIKDMHVISYVGEGDYGPILSSKAK